MAQNQDKTGIPLWKWGFRSVAVHWYIKSGVPSPILARSHPGVNDIIRHISCILLLELVHNFPKVVGVWDFCPYIYVQQDPRFLFKKTRRQPPSAFFIFYTSAQFRVTLPHDIKSSVIMRDSVKLKYIKLISEGPIYHCPFH